MIDTPSPPPGVVNRRFFLKAAGAGTLAVAGASLLTACTGDDGSTAKPGTSSKVGGKLTLLTYSGYEGKEALKDWYAKNDIKLNFKAITNEPVPDVFLGPGGHAYDAGSANQADVEYELNPLKISTPITVEEVPNLAGLLPFFRDGDFWKVSDGVYNSVPWTWGPIGINYREDKVQPSDLSSWQNLLDPSWKGRIGTFDESSNMVSTGAVATGNDPGKITREQLNGPIKDYLTKLMRNVKVLSTSGGDQVNTLVAGDVDIQLVGLTFYVGEAAKQGKKVGFLVPEVVGSYGFVDCVIIPPSAPHRANALAYANALIGGDTAIKMANSLAQLSTSEAVNPKLDPKVRELFPADLAKYSGSTLKFNRTYHDPKGQYATGDEWSKLWLSVKTGA